MKFSEMWLKERVNSGLDIQAFIERLTMAGLEVEMVEEVAGTFSNIVVGEIISLAEHPATEKFLHICQVDTGSNQLLQIICGDPLIFPGMKVAVALQGALLPPNKVVEVTDIAGISSYGMLCSAAELGLTESADDILQLPADAPVGGDLRKYLELEDKAITLNLTPNRGDCLSIEGIARETAALCGVAFNPLKIEPVKPQISACFPVELIAEAECPHYIGRIIHDVEMTSPTPLWIQERLRRSGLRSIDPVVDITNYVMLELGQPLHAFDLERLSEKIVIRKAFVQEKIVLLNDQEIQLDPDTLVIADSQGALALAGIMGGRESGVNTHTRHIFLESAFFTPHLIAGKARRYGLHTDSSHRFERGVDVALQRAAIERATQLIQEWVGGKAGPLTEITATSYMPVTKTIELRKRQLQRLLGHVIPDEKVISILQHLGMQVETVQGGWQVTPPSFRFDINREEDLIEEAGRIYGYSHIPSKKLTAALATPFQNKAQITLDRMRQCLIDRGYSEVITYSFVDPKFQHLMYPTQEGYQLQNPISEDLSQMRLSLLPGLLASLIYNRNRKQSRMQLVETGLRFIKDSNQKLLQERVISGLISGSRWPEQWSEKAVSFDFYDIKHDIEALIDLTHAKNEFSFKPCRDSTILHPGQAASLFRGNHCVGIVGALHPRLMQALELDDAVLVFELLFNDLASAKLPKFATLSKYPSIRRDIAILVDEGISAENLCNSIVLNAGKLLIDLIIFDVYQGNIAKSGQKSMAFGLLLQHPHRTLVDEEVNQLMEKVVNGLSQEYKAILRN